MGKISSFFALITKHSILPKLVCNISKSSGAQNTDDKSYFEWRQIKHIIRTGGTSLKSRSVIILLCKRLHSCMYCSFFNNCSLAILWLTIAKIVVLGHCDMFDALTMKHIKNFSEIK